MTESNNIIRQLKNNNSTQNSNSFSNASQPNTAPKYEEFFNDKTKRRQPSMLRYLSKYFLETFLITYSIYSHNC